MKTTKRFLSFLLTLAMMFSVIAVAVVPTAAAEESTSTVTVVVPLDGYMVSLDGSFTVSGEATTVIKDVTVNTGWGGNVSVDALGGSFLLFGGTEPSKCILTLEVEISGEVGKKATIEFNYEYDETADLYAARKTGSKQVDLTVVSYTELRKVIQRAESLVAGEYVSLDPIVEPLAHAKAVLNASYNQTEVNDATSALRTALNDLQKKVTYARLDKAIAEAEALDYYLYDLELWATLEAALEKAKAIRVKEGATQPQITFAAIELEAAIEALEYASTDNLDLSALQSAYDAAITLQQIDYEAEGWDAFVLALADAEAALQNAVSQHYIDAVTEALNEAMAALVPNTPENADLRVLIARVEGLNPADYDADSWAAVQAALDAANLAVNASLQSEIEAAYAALLAAKDALVLYIDYTELTTAIAAAEALTEADYTAETWAAMITALNDAKDVLESADQDTVTNAAHALELALAKLEKVPAKVVVDFAALNAAIAAAEALTEADYTAETWAAVKTALDAAKALTGSDDQTAVTAAAHALELAMAELEKKPVVVQIDYAKLNDEITAAEALTEADYTADTWAALAAALNAAKAAKESGDQRAVDAAAYELAAAVAALAKVPAPIVVDYTALNAAIAAAEALTQADYTAETWAAMTAALEAAKALVESDDQAAVTAAAHALDLAVAKLEKPVSAPVVEVDYSSLNAAISAAEALTEADYTAETWTAMTTALTAAKAALTSDDQAAVASAAQALIAAVAALRTPVVTVPGEAETIIVEPTDPFCNKGSHTVWPVLFGIFLALTVALAALIVVYLILKKKKENDDTPVVDYDIDEDVADETEEAAEESTEDVAEEVAEETEAAEAEAYADDEADTTAE